MTRRLVRVLAELYDEATGQIVFAPLRAGPWPPPVEGELENPGQAASEEIPGLPTPAAPVTTALAPMAEVETEADTEAEIEAEAETEATIAAEPGTEEATEAETPAPLAFVPFAPPPGSPATTDERMPEITVIDSPSELNLRWDVGVTESGRKMMIAPFRDGMWLIIDNKGEHLVFYKRAGKRIEYETQGSTREGMALATMLSKNWLAEGADDQMLQWMATFVATEVARWVGLRIEVYGDHYHFRKGRVRREALTTIVAYVGRSPDNGHPRVELRLTVGPSREEIAVWALWYAADGQLMGSYSESAFRWSELATLRNLRFGPPPGKILQWRATGKYEETSEWGGNTIVLQHGRGLSSLSLRQKRGDAFLDCGEADALKLRALSVVLRHLRTRSARRREPRQVEEVPGTNAAPEAIESAAAVEAAETAETAKTAETAEEKTEKEAETTATATRTRGRKATAKQPDPDPEPEPEADEDDDLNPQESMVLQESFRSGIADVLKTLPPPQD